MQSTTMSKLKQVLSFESVIIITQNGMCLLFIITWPEGAFLEKYLIQNQIAREQTKTIYGTSHFVFIADSLCPIFGCCKMFVDILLSEWL